MYFSNYGGSALLHLLAAHPRVVALFGITATVSLLMAPQGPGRQLGTAGHIERIETAIRPQIAVTEVRRAQAERAAERIIAAQADAEIAAMVREMLRRCGPGCTDISTERVASDEELLKRVLVLYALDEAARTSPADAVTPDAPARLPAAAVVRR